MKPNDLAKLLNISPVTLRRWSGSDYSEFLSTQAGRQYGAKRNYTDLDARILGYAADMKSRNVAAAEILKALKTAQSENWRSLPPLHGMAGDDSVDLVPVEAVNEKLRSLMVQYEQITRERDELQKRLETALGEKGELQKRLTELTETSARLEGQLSQYSIGGKRYNAIVLVVIALVVGIILTLLIVVLIAVLKL